MATTKTVNMIVLGTVETPIGSVEYRVDGNSDKQYGYLYFNGIIKPAKGVKPAMIMTSTVAEYEKKMGSLSVAGEESYMALLGFNSPAISAALKASKVKLESEENGVRA